MISLVHNARLNYNSKQGMTSGHALFTIYNIVSVQGALWLG